MSTVGTYQDDSRLTREISAAMVALYATFYAHNTTTATTYINDNVVICLLENILTEDEGVLVAAGVEEVIDGRVAFQSDTQDEFTAAVQRLTHRHVTAFLSANQTAPGVACELFILDAAPLAMSARGKQ